MAVVWLSIVLSIGIIGFSICYKQNKVNQQTIIDQLTYFQLVESSKDVIYYFEVKPELRFKYISPSLDHFLGEGTIKEAFESCYAPFERIHPEDFEKLNKKVAGQLEYSQIIIQRWKDNDGNFRWFEEYATPIYENNVFVGVQGFMRNIDDKIELQQELQFRITHDPLTGIYNREYFERKFEENNRKLNVPVAIIVCDLDELKYVNDHFGHKKGDALIIAAAKLLNQFSSETVIVARSGGDEFAIVAESITEEETEGLVHKVVGELHNQYSRETERPIELSIGYAFNCFSKGNMTELFSRADRMMYENKSKRKLLPNNTGYVL